jgi:RNA polymerase sigma-70 factor (ECF subfamily)
MFHQDDANTDALMCAYYAGDDAALAQLVNQLGEWMRHVVLSRLRSGRVPGRRQMDHLADDIVQEVWRKVLRTRAGSGRFDPQRGRLLPWLRSIVEREIVNAFREFPRLSRSCSRLALHGKSVCPTPDDDDPLDPFQLAVRRDAARQLAMEMAALPEDDREVLRLRFWEQMSQTEIACRLGVSSVWVCRRLRQACLRLRQRLRAQQLRARLLTA